MRIQFSDGQTIYSFASELTMQQALDLFVNRHSNAAEAKVYRVIDNGSPVIATLDELTALRKLRTIVESREVTKDWAWVEEDDLC